MSKPEIAYVNGEFIPIAQAKVSVLDRGFLFADGVYEVSAVVHGRLVDNDAHMKRLERSLGELQLASPVPVENIPGLMEELVRREELQEGMVYLQITRGADTSRNFSYPDPSVVPSSLVMFVQERNMLNCPVAERGGRAITIPDVRWRRRDIKSIALLPQAMGKQMAKLAGVDEALMVEDGFINEGTSSSAGIVTANDELIVPPVTNDILDSITRRAMLKLLEETSLRLVERRFTPDEAYAAKEAFVASATALVLPIVEIDGNPIGSGKPGEYVPLLRKFYFEEFCSL